MRRQERVSKVIGRGIPDRVPLGELVVDDGFIRDYMGYEQIDSAGRAEFYALAGLDLICLQDADEAAFFHRETDLYIFALVSGGLSGLLRSHGFNRAMLFIAQKPHEAAKIMEQSINENLHRAEKLLKSGAHGVIIADDIAYNQGPYISPALLQQTLFPHLERAVSAIKARGCPVFFHSDGNLQLILPDLARAGFNGIQCLEQSAGQDLGWLKANYGRKLCLMGGLDLHLLAAKPDEKKLLQAVTYALKNGAPAGGYIFGTNGGLYQGLSPQAVSICYQTAIKQGRYY